MDTVVLEVQPEHGAAILRYPEAFCCQLVEVPYGTVGRHGETSGRHKAAKQAKKKATRKCNKGEILQQEYHLQVPYSGGLP